MVVGKEAKRERRKMKKKGATGGLLNKVVVGCWVCGGKNVFNGCLVNHSEVIFLFSPSLPFSFLLFI